MYSLLKRWLPLLVIVSLMIIAFATGLHEKISLEALQTHKSDLYSYVVAHQFLSVLVFMTVYVAVVALSLPFALLMSLTGGFLFGKILGTIYVVCAATSGATIIFIVARSTFGKSLQEKAGNIYKRIENNMTENAAGYLLFMRFVPLFPFFLVNIVPALFNIRVRVFVLTTFFGIIPGSFVYVNVGEQMGELESLNDLVSGETLLAFAMLGVLALVPAIYKQLKAKREAS